MSKISKPVGHLLYGPKCIKGGYGAFCGLWYNTVVFGIANLRKKIPICNVFPVKIALPEGISSLVRVLQFNLFFCAYKGNQLAQKFKHLLTTKTSSYASHLDRSDRFRVSEYSR